MNIMRVLIQISGDQRSDPVLDEKTIWLFREIFSKTGRALNSSVWADVRPHLRQVDLFVLLLDKVGFPLAWLDAMVCGLPAVVTDVEGNRGSCRP